MLLRSLALLISFGVLSACMPGEIPKETLQFSEENPARRKLESRSFETGDETALIAAGAAVLQELGFTLDARSNDLGLLAASKRGSAYNAGEIAASAATVVLSQVLSVPTLPFSKDQSIRTSLVTRPGEMAGRTVVRITFQRVVWNSEGRVSKSELLEDPVSYRDFFAKLAKAAGLEAHEL